MPNQHLLCLSLVSCLQKCSCSLKKKVEISVCLHQKTVSCKSSGLLAVLSGLGLFSFVTILGFRTCTHAILDVCELPRGGYLFSKCLGKTL